MPHFTEPQIRRQNRIVLILLAILIIGGLVVHGWFNHELLPVDTSDRTPRSVKISQGMTDKQVGVLLQKKRLVRSAYVFNYYLQTHKTNGIKAGRFYLRRSQSTPQIVEKLQEKPNSQTTVHK